MKLSINKQGFRVPREEELLFLQQFQALLLAEYSKLPTEYRLMLKPLARGILYKMEDKVRKLHGREKALLFRPAKRQDPVLFFSKIMTGILQEALKHVSLDIETAGDTVAAFSCSISGEGQTGGQMAFNGDQWLRQNNGVEIS
jgi:hypothetical protein